MLDGPPIAAIVFDMDGVLVDARDWHYDALNLALAEHGHAIGRQEHLARFDGLPTHVKLGMLTAERGLDPALHGLIAGSKQAHLARIAAQRCRPIPQVRAAVTALRARGYRLAVASNATRANVDLLLRRSGLRDLFHLALSAEDVPMPKPHPAIYREAMRRLAVGPAETLVVEDSDVGVAAATASGAALLRVGSPAEVRPALFARRLGFAPAALPAAPRLQPAEARC